MLVALWRGKAASLRSAAMYQGARTQEQPERLQGSSKQRVSTCLSRAPMGARPCKRGAIAYRSAAEGRLPHVPDLVDAWDLQEN